MKTLEIKDVAGYLPYGLKLLIYEDIETLGGFLTGSWFNENGYEIECADGEIKPILRPLSDLYKPIIHDGKEEIPILECAKILKDSKYWHINDRDKFIAVCPNYRFGIMGYANGGVTACLYDSNGRVVNTDIVKIIDYLNSRFIDYRGLIEAGLAVSVKNAHK